MSEISSLFPENTPPGLLRFAADTQTKAHRRGVAITMLPTESVLYGTQQDIRVSGYFIDRPLVKLCVGVGGDFDRWMPILLHEACHMDQWIENDPTWSEAFLDGREATDWLDDWTRSRIELNDERKQDVIRRAMLVEMNCEQRVVKAVARYGIPMDVESYIQKANAYVFSYAWAGISRQWHSEERAPYRLPEVWQAAPTRFPLDLSTIPDELLTAYRNAYGSNTPLCRGQRREVRVDAPNCKLR